MVKNLSVTVEDIKSCRFDPWVGKVPWSRKWHTTLIFLPGEPPGQRSLAGMAQRITMSRTQLKYLTAAAAVEKWYR